MRRLWPAIGVFALVAGCGRPNPGFKLVESGGGGDSDSASSGATDSGVVTGTPPTSTTTTGVTGTASGTVSGGDESMSATVSASTGDTGTTMESGQWVYPIPADCMDPNLQTMETLEVVADTFFLNEIEVSQCSWLTEMGLMGPDCLNLQFSEASEFQVYLKDSGNNNPKEDLVSIYAVRFTPPMYMGLAIPAQSFLEVKVKVHVFKHPETKIWNGMLAVRRFTDGDIWSAEDGLEFTPCYEPAASYRCRSCPTNAPVDDTCADEWGNLHAGVPYDPKEAVVKTLNVPLPGVDGLDVPIEFTPADVTWLTDEGMMLMPAVDLERKTVGIKTSESGNPPVMFVRYCTPQWVLN